MGYVAFKFLCWKGFLEASLGRYVAHREFCAFPWFELAAHPVGATARPTGTVASEEEMQSVGVW